MKVLFVVPEIRVDSKPWHIPLWAGILSNIVENKRGQVGILDLNALRMTYGKNVVPEKSIIQELSSDKWDLICIGGLTSTYSRIKELVSIIRKTCPETIIFAGGGWSTYNPDEILQLIPEIDMICIGEGEETFSEVYDNISKSNFDFSDVKGLALRDKEKIKFTYPRALISNLDSIPYPAYHLLELDIYFTNSSIPHSVESFNARKRLSAVWERGCPRGCTFCSHNGMSRIDLQNIYGEGDRKKGELLVREVDKEEETFQLPARWPSPEYAVKNVQLLRDRYEIDYLTILDENMTSNKKWTKEFCRLYKELGLDESVKWGTFGDAPSVAVQPDLVGVMKDAGCTFISFGFESASDKVLNEDYGKGQTRAHEQKTIDTIKKVGMTPISTFMIGSPNENINDLMETVDFWIKNNIEIDPFICTPFVGSPLYYNYKDFILGQYDEKWKIINEHPGIIDDHQKNEIKLKALDKFMSECGDAFDYTATVSQVFTIPELIALKRFMFKHETDRMLQWAHKKFEDTGNKQWLHDEKWKKYCQVCKARDELMPGIIN